MDWQRIHKDRSTEYCIEKEDRAARIYVESQEVELHEESEPVELYKTIVSFALPDYETEWRKVVGVDLAETEAEEIVEDMRTRLDSWEEIEEMVE